MHQSYFYRGFPLGCGECLPKVLKVPASIFTKNLVSFLLFASFGFVATSLEDKTKSIVSVSNFSISFISPEKRVNVKASFASHGNETKIDSSKSVEQIKRRGRPL